MNGVGGTADRSALLVLEDFFDYLRQSVANESIDRKKKKRHYSKGEINRLIDSLLHPLFDQSSAFMAVDVALHGLVEQNPRQTLKKFVHYTLPEIVKEILKSQQHWTHHDKWISARWCID